MQALVSCIKETVTAKEDLVLTGGVSAPRDMLSDLMGEILNRPVLVPLLPQLTGAFGAALLAGDIDIPALREKYMQ
jgi:activator of 2-hydroxyglutaryl-CoA dehydratase